MSFISRYLLLFAICAIPMISTGNVFEPTAKIQFSYNQLLGKHFQPIFGTPHKGMIINEEILVETIEFQFFEDYILYTIDCFTTKLQIKSVKTFSNNHPHTKVTTALKIKVEKNKDLKTGFRDIYVYLNADGSINHIEFGFAKLYES